MNEIEKELEEMARIIAFELCPYGKLHAKLYEGRARCASNDNFAECTKINKVVDKLHNAGYRNVKDKVVLDKEEYQKDFSNQFNKGYEKGSKETAKEILQKIESLYAYLDNEDEIFIGCLLEDLKELAKQYEVGVE